MIIRRLFKQGGSVVVSIPKNYLSDLGLEINDYVVLDLKPKEHIKIRPNHKILNDLEADEADKAN